MHGGEILGCKHRLEGAVHSRHSELLCESGCPRKILIAYCYEFEPTNRRDSFRMPLGYITRPKQRNLAH